MKIVSRRVLWKSTLTQPQLTEAAACFPMVAKVSDSSLFRLYCFVAARPAQDALKMAVRKEVACRAFYTTQNRMEVRQ